MPNLSEILALAQALRRPSQPTGQTGLAGSIADLLGPQQDPSQFMDQNRNPNANRYRTLDKMNTQMLGPTDITPGAGWKPDDYAWNPPAAGGTPGQPRSQRFSDTPAGYGEMYRMPPATPSDSATLAQLLRQTDQSWKRQDGTQKGQGFLGPLKFHDGRTSTELSIGVDIGGKETQIPSLVPTLTSAEVAHLMQGGQMTEEIVQKAIDHARMRMGQGKSPFAE